MTNQRLAIISGIRTPQAKAFGALGKVSAVELGVHAARSVLQRAKLESVRVDEVIFGNVASPPDAANIARVIALKAGVPQDRIAHTVNRNCASGMETVVSGWQTLAAGRSNLILVGGTESMSRIPMLASEDLQAKLMVAGRAKTLLQKLGAYARFRPQDFKPRHGVELGLTDPTCGLNMGQTAEVLAEEFAISRDEQDTYAVQSHHKGVEASKRCFLSGEISPMTIGGEEFKLDVGPRANQTMNQLAKLRPIFKSNGTVTAGNSCPLTDGATALLLSREEDVSSYTTAPLGFVSAYAIAGCDPRRMGLGPVYATSKLLRETGLKLSDFDLIEINEAFAAQVIACMRAFESVEFANKELGQTQAIGPIDPEKLNVNGGAIALGHPVGATGARLVLTLLRSLRERGLHRGLATLCVGGGQGFAIAVETE